MNDWARLRAFKQVPIEFYGRRLIMHARKARLLLAGAFVHGHRASETNRATYQPRQLRHGIRCWNNRGRERRILFTHSHVSCSFSRLSSLIITSSASLSLYGIALLDEQLETSSATIRLNRIFVPFDDPQLFIVQWSYSIYVEFLLLLKGENPTSLTTQYHRNLGSFLSVTAQIPFFLFIFLDYAYSWPRKYILELYSRWWLYVLETLNI